MAQEQIQTDSKSLSKKLSHNTDINTTNGELQKQQQNHTTTSGTFSIATPAVTTILPMTESMSDTFMLQNTSYTQDCLVMDKSFSSSSSMNANNDNGGVFIANEISLDKDMKKDHQQIIADQSSYNQTTDLCKTIESESAEPQTIGSVVSIKQPDSDLTTQSSSSTNKQSAQQSKQQDESNNQKMCKKRNKVAKKNTKLDAKSKLEKSRQSARECRARKKLRYQYLEDLVTNREKAVVKLREELNMFCELSKQIDSGSITDNDRRLLIDQTKENNRNE